MMLGEILDEEERKFVVCILRSHRIAVKESGGEWTDELQYQVKQFAVELMRLVKSGKLPFAQKRMELLMSLN